MRKNYYGSIEELVDNVIGNHIDGLYGYALVRGNECYSLKKCMEVSYQKHEVLYQECFIIATIELRDLFMKELTSYKHPNTILHKSFLG